MTTSVNRVGCLSDLQKTDTHEGQYFTNLPQTGREYVKIVNRIKGPASVPEKEFETDGFAFAYYYCHPVYMIDNDSGERVRQTRVVLMDKDLRHLTFISQGVTQSLGDILEGCGSELPDKPIRVARIVVSMGKGREFHRLDMLD